MADEQHCAFCARKSSDAVYLVASPPPTVCICDACVDGCLDVIREAKRAKKQPVARKPIVRAPLSAEVEAEIQAMEAGQACERCHKPTQRIKSARWCSTCAEKITKARENLRLRAKQSHLDKRALARALRDVTPTTTAPASTDERTR